MKNKFLFLWALLVSICVQVNAQNWTWTGETPAAGGSYYLYNLGAANFLDMNNGAPVNAVGDPLLFTLTEDLDGTDLQYTQNGYTYYIYQSAGTYGYWKDKEANVQSGPSTVTMKSFGDGYRWKMKGYNGGYQIYSNHKYSSSWGSLAHRSDNDRYIRYTGSGYDCSRTANQYNTNNGTFLFITEAQVAARDAYLTAWNNANNQKVGVADYLQPYLNTLLGTAVNYANAAQITSELNYVVNQNNAYLVWMTQKENASLTNAVDASCLIINANADCGVNGWTGEFGILAATGSSDGVFFEPAGWWKQSASMSQKMENLPNGTYVLTMSYQAAGNVHVTLSGNDDSNSVDGTNEGWKTLVTRCHVTDGTLTITASSQTDETQYTWFNTDHFTLHYLGSEDIPTPSVSGKNFVVVKGTGKHISRGGKWGTQAILDYYGVPVIVENNQNLVSFHFLDNDKYMGAGVGDDWMYTDRENDEACRQYIMTAGTGEHAGEYQLYNPFRKKYLYHGTQGSFDAVFEGDEGDWFHFEPFSEYQEHLAGIQNDEAKRISERAGYSITTHAEYETLIDDLEEGATTVFPSNDAENTAAATYYEKRNAELAVPIEQDPAPRDLVGGDKVKLNLTKGLYILECDAFQQAMDLARLQENQGFRGLTYMYVKAGGQYISKGQLMSITENAKGSALPTDAASAESALDNGEYPNRILFFLNADADVEFGIENPQRLGNGVDETAGSWVAFKNIKVLNLGDVTEVTLSCKAGKFGTFVAPYDVVLPEGVNAYSVAVGAESKVMLTKVVEAGETLQAGNPVMLYNDTENAVAETYRMKVTDDTQAGQITKNGLVGFYKSGLTIPTGSYVLQTQNDEQAFYLVNTAFTGTAFRCYLPAAASGVKVMSIGFADDEDAMTGVNADKNSNAIYDLQGRRVEKVQKGLYIQNGKVYVK